MLATNEGLAKRDPANMVWQRDLFVSNNNIGDVLVAQGDGPGALAAYQAGLAISEALAKRDWTNTLWQVDVAVSCAKLVSLDSLVPAKELKEYLISGQQILLNLKDTGKLHANQDLIDLYDKTLGDL